jgi:hypothetical protein
MSTQIKLGWISLLAVVTFGCGAARRTAETNAAETAGVFGCALDSDCIAIEDDSSCDSGVLVAVNKDRAADYCAASDGAPDCSIAAAGDTRVAQCDFHAHRCQMIDPTQIHCEGFIFPNHACPTGFFCDFAGRVPDVGGSCVAQSN